MTPSEYDRHFAHVLEDLMDAFDLPEELQNQWRLASDALSAVMWIDEFMESYDMPAHIRHAFGCPVRRGTALDGIAFMAALLSDHALELCGWEAMPGARDE